MGAFEPVSFRDRYQDALNALVESKTKGLARAPSAVEEPPKVVNLMDALKQSLKSKTAKPVHAPTRRARHRPVKKAHRSAARARKAS